MQSSPPHPCTSDRPDRGPDAPPRIAWVTRSFLDYRVPVFAALSELVDGNVWVLFSGNYVPQCVTDKMRSALGGRAIPLSGEWKIGPEDRDFLANRNLSIRFQPGLLTRVRALLPDVMVCDGFFKWTLPCLVQRIVAGTPLVVCYERTEHTERRAQRARILYRKFVLRRTDAVCCTGRLCGEYTQSLGMPAERITYGHMAADTGGIAEKASRVSRVACESLRSDLGVQGLMFLYVGQLVPRKGIRELLAGWAEFERVEPDATLCLVGDGPEHGALQALCREKSVERVRFVGAVDYDELPPYYAAADALVMPTLEDNWSLVVPEAMACGLPILCSEYNGCWPELVHEGRNGWVFNPLQQKDTFRALRAAVASAGRLTTMGEHSGRIVAGHGPYEAAESVLQACRIAIELRSRTRRHSAKTPLADRV